MKRILPRKLERFQSLITSIENKSVTDFLIEGHAYLDIIEDDYVEFMRFLKEYQDQYDFTESEKVSIRISLIRYLSIAIREGLILHNDENFW